MTKKKRNKFSIEERESIVLEVLQGTESYSSVARKLQTSRRLISLWVEAYKIHGSSGLSMKTFTTFSGEFKLRLLQEMLRDGLSLHQVSVKYLISPSVIANWKRQYEKSGVVALYKKKQKGRPPKMKKKLENTENKSNKKLTELIKENERLQAENDFLKKLQALIQKQEALKKG